MSFQSWYYQKQCRKAAYRSLKIGIWLLIFYNLTLLVGKISYAQAPLGLDVSGYLKSFNFFTRTTGLNPEMADKPTLRSEAKEDLFNTTQRARLQVKGHWKPSEKSNLLLRIDYDHQAHFGSFISKGDFRLAQKLNEERQFLDLSQTLVEDEDAFYEHRLYRAMMGYEYEDLELWVGRKQIPWGVGHFFTPTDVFNPFNPTQLELDERQGVDAIDMKHKNIQGNQFEFVYTPPGKRLHPQRIMARVSRDIRDYEVGILGGRVRRDYALGMDVQGNLKEMAIRGEFLYKEANFEKDFIQFTLNADYNFPHNIYTLLEYHFNGQGRRSPDDYQRDRSVRGDILSLGRNYLGFVLGYDLHPLVRIENRTLWNMDDLSLFFRPELQYEIKRDLLLSAGSQFFVGQSVDEYGSPENLYFGEIKFNF